MLMAVLCGVILSDSHLRAEESSLEYQLKAAFLVNFARFIAWPETAFPSEQREFILCVAGKDPFGSALAGIENKKIAGRPVRVIYVPKLEEPPPCHLLFVSRSEETGFAQQIPALGRRGIVTVSDISGFVRVGGHIEFFNRQDRLSFIINHSALKAAGIRVGASLLDLAAAVE